MLKSAIILCMALQFLLPCAAQKPAQKHPELGEVAWLRNYQQAVDQARKSNKPILLLFQEVPG